MTAACVCCQSKYAVSYWTVKRDGFRVECHPAALAHAVYVPSRVERSHQPSRNNGLIFYSLCAASIMVP
jgi:hypothetical protein